MPSDPFRRRRFRTFVLLCVCSWQFAADAEGPRSANFPLSKGTYWIYRGTVQGHDTQLTGYLVDLMNAEIIANGRVNTMRELSLLVREGEKYYVLQDKEMQAAVRRMKDSADDGHAEGSCVTSPIPREGRWVSSMASALLIFSSITTRRVARY